MIRNVGGWHRGRVDAVAAVTRIISSAPAPSSVHIIIIINISISNIGSISSICRIVIRRGNRGGGGGKILKGLS